MRRVLMLPLVLLLFIANTAYAEPAEHEVRESFNKYTAKVMNEVFSTYEGEHFTIFGDVRFPGQIPVWMKTIDTIDRDYYIDIQQADSTDFHYTGIMAVTKTTLFFKGVLHQNREKAIEAATEINESKDHRYLFFFSYEGGQWTALGARKLINGEWLELKSRDIFTLLKCEDKDWK